MSFEPGTESTGLLSFDCVTANFLPTAPCNRDVNVEVVFVIDRSGSMDGDAIKYAKNALLILLKSLPVGCRFQIIGFGSTFEPLFTS